MESAADRISMEGDAKYAEIVRAISRLCPLIDGEQDYHMLCVLVSEYGTLRHSAGFERGLQR